MVVTRSLVDVVDAGREVDEAAASSEDDPHAAATSEMVKRLIISLAGRFNGLIISFPVSFGRERGNCPAMVRAEPVCVSTGQRTFVAPTRIPRLWSSSAQSGRRVKN